VKRNTLESHESLANLLVRSRIDCSALSISEELIQHIITALATLIVGGSSMLTDVAAVIDWVIDRGVRGGLLRGIVAVVGSGVGAISGGTWVHLGSMTIVSVGSFASLSVPRALPMMPMLFRRSKEDRVISMSLDMLLQILRTLERLSTEVTFVRLQRNMDSDVGSDMITLDSGGPARVPSAGEVQVVCALSSDMFLADVFKKSLRR
jgi:hypothetical protein